MSIFSIYQPIQLKNVLDLYSIQQTLLVSTVNEIVPQEFPPLEDNGQSGEGKAGRSKLYFNADSS